MIVNVSYSDFDCSRSEIDKCLTSANNAHSTISSAISDANLHMSTDLSKVNNKLSSWRSKLSSLKSKEQSLKSELATLESQLAKYKAMLSSLQSQLASCRPPKQVTETYYDSNGNPHTRTYTYDPDAGKRAALQSQIAAVQSKIQQLESEIASVEKELETCQRDIQIAEAYIKELESTKALIDKAINNIHQCKRYAEEAITYFRSETSDVLYAIDQLKRHIDEYNSKSFRDSSYLGQSHQFSIPGNTAGNYYAPKAPTIVNTELNENKTGLKTKKLKVVDEDAVIIEIIGVYDTEDELKADLKEVDQVYKNEITLKIKKMISLPCPCLKTIIELENILKEFGYTAKTNSMGNRYTDPRGYIYFNK